MDYGFWWIPLGIAGFYLLAPLAILLTHRIKRYPTILEFDPSETPVPSELLAVFERVGAAVSQEGFAPVAAVAMPDPIQNVMAVLQLWEHPVHQDSFLLCAAYANQPGNPPSLAMQFAEFSTAFRDRVDTVDTNNATVIHAFQHWQVTASANAWDGLAQPAQTSPAGHKTWTAYRPESHRTFGAAYTSILCHMAGSGAYLCSPAVAVAASVSFAMRESDS